MRHLRDADRCTIVLERGEPVLESIIAACNAEKITSAYFQGIGAVSDVEIGYYTLDTKSYSFTSYPETFEVASMQGNITLVEGKPFVHAHAVLSRCDETLGCIGGHIKEARVAVTLEISMRVLEMPLSRAIDDTIGLKLIAL